MSGARERAADIVAALRMNPWGRRALDDWPRDPSDPALRAVGTMLETLEDHLGDARHAPLLARCEAFLRTDLPYRWPVEDFGAPIGAGPRWLPFLLVALAAVSLALGTPAGLLLGAVLLAGAVAWWPLDRRLRRGWVRTEAALRAAGDAEAWPFLRREDVPPEARMVART